MSRDPKIDAMIAIAIGLATGNPAEGLEAIEKANQSEAYNNCEVPKEMRPSREAFEALGFSFEDIPGDDVLCKASIPRGWTRKKNGYYTTFYDENGVERAEAFYKGALYDRRGHLYLVL